MAKLRLLLADDHGLVLEGLRSLLSKDFEVAGVAENGRELLEQAEKLQPDLVLLDISMPILNGLEAARQIKARWPIMKILFITQRSDREYIRAAFRLGASGYILKQSVVAEISEAVREIADGRYYVSVELRYGLTEMLLNTTTNPSEFFGDSLTPRQREVLQLVAEGKSNKEVATILGISVKTVDFHKAGIMDELGLRTTAELTRYAIEHGITAR